VTAAILRTAFGSELAAESGTTRARPFLTVLVDMT